ncbi:hypothetical protein ABW21_db0205421 [Orbilia brochopaga]|nr:hypothetical protein ABW21_db0205421 [Drechslerella brochopaga]
MVRTEVDTAKLQSTGKSSNQRDPSPHSEGSSEEKARHQVTPIMVAVVGATGVGKSTFIRHATGNEEVKIGNSLKSATETAKLFQVPGTNIMLMDTPGYDDGFKRDADVLEDIASCLAAAYRQGWKLCGVLYLHPITEPRVKRSTLRNINLFAETVGMEHMPNCLLVTTKWGVTNEPTELLDARENELLTSKEFWQPLMERGARSVRFGDSKETALSIISFLTCKPDFVPLITEEFAQQNRELGQTTAGQQLSQYLNERENHLKFKFAQGFEKWNTARENRRREEEADESGESSPQTIDESTENRLADDENNRDQPEKDFQEIHEARKRLKSKENPNANILKWLVGGAVGLVVLGGIAMAASGALAAQAAVGLVTLAIKAL